MQCDNCYFIVTSILVAIYFCIWSCCNAKLPCAMLSYHVLTHILHPHTSDQELQTIATQHDNRYVYAVQCVWQYGMHITLPPLSAAQLRMATMPVLVWEKWCDGNEKLGGGGEERGRGGEGERGRGQRLQLSCEYVRCRQTCVPEQLWSPWCFI